jgi:hypothetical protein
VRRQELESAILLADVFGLRQGKVGKRAGATKGAVFGASGESAELGGPEELTVAGESAGSGESAEPGEIREPEDSEQSEGLSEFQELAAVDAPSDWVSGEIVDRIQHRKVIGRRFERDKLDTRSLPNTSQYSNASLRISDAVFSLVQAGQVCDHNH